MVNATQIADLRCEYLVDPLGIDEKIPRLSWLMQSVTARCAPACVSCLHVASSVELLQAGPSRPVG